jgi:cytochrome P450
MLRTPLTSMVSWSRAHGGLLRLKLPGPPTYLLTEPALIEQVLIKDWRNYRKDAYTRMLALILGEGLLTAEHEVWKHHRRVVQPGFHVARIRGYADRMVSLTNEALPRFSGEIDVHAELMRLTLHIVTETLFGADLTEDAEALGRALGDLMDDYAGMSELMMRLPAWVPLPGVRRRAAALHLINTLVHRLLDQRRQAGGDQGDLLSMLLHATQDGERPLSQEELRDEVVTLLLAGHETTAIGLAVTLHQLATHPEVQERLTREVREVLGSRPATFEDLTRLTYTSAVIDEAMRIYPPAWAIGREALQDVTLGDHTLPAGSQIVIAQWVTHRDPRWFDDPETFRPERWLDGLRERLPPGVYYPFGGGPRVCIGQRFASMEAVLALATLVQARRFSVTERTRLELVPSITLRPREGLHLKAEPL